MNGVSKGDIARTIDHTVLKAFATESEITKLCTEAAKYNFASVCVNPIYVKLASDTFSQLDSNIKVCTVVGFPLGNTTTGNVAYPQIINLECKVFETEDAIKNGADEIDMVIAVGMIKSQQYDYVREEIQRIHDICKNHGKLLKEEITKASELTFEAGAEFVKTSTGFGPSSATIAAVKVMANVAKRFGGRVKAAGGIRSFDDAVAMINAGAYPYLPIS